MNICLFSFCLRISGFLFSIKCHLAAKENIIKPSQNMYLIGRANHNILIYSNANDETNKPQDFVILHTYCQNLFKCENLSLRS